MRYLRIRGALTLGAVVAVATTTFIDQTTSPATLNDKEWIAVDDNTSSPFRDRIYVTFTRFLFNPSSGAYVQSPIFFASSSDGGATFTTPKSIAGNVLYSQGSRPVVGPDGSLYVFWDGSRRHDELDSTWVAKSNRQRCDVEQAGPDLAARRDRAARQHALPPQQLSGRRRCAQRRRLRNLDDRDVGRLGRDVEQVDRRRHTVDVSGTGIPCGVPDCGRLPRGAAVRRHARRA